jgi:integrase
MATGRLTAAAVRGLRAKGKYLDGHGLMLNVVAPDQRYWMFRFKRQGRDRIMSLGNADVMSLAEAREAHRAARVLLDKGINPLDVKQEKAQRAKAQRQKAVTFSAAAEAYIVAHRAGWRGRGERYWRNSLAVHVMPVFGAKPVGNVGVEDVLKALQPLWTTRTVTATILRSRIELVLDHAKARGWRPADAANPATWRGNLKSLLPPPAKVHRVSHQAALAWQEAPALLARLCEASDGSMAERCLALVILTVVRNAEARGARWSEIDMAERTWTIPAQRMKGGRREHRVPLSDAAMAILSALDEVRTGDVVFFGPQGRPLSHNTMLDVLRRLGHPGITVHGFRSSFRDWAADTGKPSDLAEAALAHVVGNAVARAYQRSDLLDARRVLMQQWADYLTREAAQVVTLRAAG